MSNDTKNKLSPITVSLHWIVAVLMISLLAIGIYMEQTSAYSLYPWHKSFGLLILVAVLPRVIWRVTQGWPEHAAEYKQSEILLSKIVHYLLIIGTVVMPISGVMMSYFGGHNVPLFGLELAPSNMDPNNPQEVLARNGDIAGAAHTVHGIAGKVLVVSVLLHVAGALKHHFMDKDGTLRRMLGKDIA